MTTNHYVYVGNEEEHAKLIEQQRRASAILSIMTDVNNSYDSINQTNVYPTDATQVEPNE